VFGTLTNTMKKKFVIAFIAISLISKAQTIGTSQTIEKYSTGMQASITTTIFGNAKDNVIDEWKKVLKDYKHEKVKDKNDEVFGDNLVIKDWGNNTVDVYTRFWEDKDAQTLKMSVAIDLGGKYLSANEKDKFELMEKIIREFALKMTKAPLETEIKNAGKQLGKFEDQEKDLISKRRDLKVDIENYNNKIKKAEEDIKLNEENQIKKKAEIESQRQLLEQLQKKLEGVN